MALFTREEFKHIMKRGLKRVLIGILVAGGVFTIIAGLALLMFGIASIGLRHPLGALIFFCPFLAFLIVFFTGLDE